MSVVVTGANGFIGMHTVRELLKEGYKVKAVDIHIDNLRQLKSKHLRLYKRDITQDKLSHIVKKGDTVLHLAAVSRFSTAQQNPELAIKVNVLGTLRMLEASKKARKFIFSSTGSVYKVTSSPIREDFPREPRNIYGLSKKMAEDLIMISKVPYIILRYGYVYGPGKQHGAVGSFINRIVNGEPPIIFGGSQVNDFTYIKDIVKANLLAITTPITNEVFNIGTGKGVTILELLHWIKHLLNSNIEPIIKPLRTDIDFPIFVYCIHKAKKILNFKPKYGLVEGLFDMLKEMHLV